MASTTFGPKEIAALRHFSLIFYEGTEVLQEELSRLISQYYHGQSVEDFVLLNKAALKALPYTVFSRNQRRFLFHNLKTLYMTDLDISLCVTLIREVFGFHYALNPYDTLWGTLPGENQILPIFDIARLWYYWNQIHHVSSLSMSPRDFHTRWYDTESAIVRLGGAKYEHLIEKRRKEEIDIEAILIKLKEEISKLQQEIEVTENKIVREVQDDSRERRAMSPSVTQRDTVQTTEWHIEVRSKRPNLKKIKNMMEPEMNEDQAKKMKETQPSMDNVTISIKHQMKETYNTQQFVTSDTSTDQNGGVHELIGIAENVSQNLDKAYSENVNIPDHESKDDQSNDRNGDQSPANQITVKRQVSSDRKTIHIKEVKVSGSGEGGSESPKTARQSIKEEQSSQLDKDTSQKMIEPSNAEQNNEPPPIPTTDLDDDYDNVPPENITTEWSDVVQETQDGSEANEIEEDPSTSKFVETLNSEPEVHIDIQKMATDDYEYVAIEKTNDDVKERSTEPYSDNMQEKNATDNSDIECETHQGGEIAEIEGPNIKIEQSSKCAVLEVEDSTMKQNEQAADHSIRELSDEKNGTDTYEKMCDEGLETEDYLTESSDPSSKTTSSPSDNSQIDKNVLPSDEDDKEIGQKDANHNQTAETKSKETAV